jgi:hypothetical protein
MSSCSTHFFEGIEVHKFDRNEPYDAAMWMLRRQVPAELADKVKLKVHIRKMKHQKGQCWNYKGDKFTFDIVIHSDMGRIKSLRTIAHETVHVAQYLTGRMKNVWPNKKQGTKRAVMWKDKEFADAQSGKAYYDSPWEKEAYGMQDKIMNAYISNHPRKNED